jgi:hypothetical protein
VHGLGFLKASSWLCLLVGGVFSFNLICFGALVFSLPFLLLRSMLTEDYHVLLFLLCTTLSVCHVLNTSIHIHGIVIYYSRREQEQELWATRVVVLQVRFSFALLTWHEMYYALQKKCSVFSIISCLAKATIIHMLGDSH